MILVSTAFAGAYLIVKGSGALVGNYPDEYTILERIKYHQFEAIPAIYYVYLALYFGLGLAGCLLQYRQQKAQENKEPELGYLSAPEEVSLNNSLRE